MPSLPVSPASDFSYGTEEFIAGDSYVIPGADIAATLPTAVEGMAGTVWHIGSSYTVTVKLPDGSTLAVLSPGDIGTVVGADETVMA